MTFPFQITSKYVGLTLFLFAKLHGGARVWGVPITLQSKKVFRNKSQFQKKKMLFFSLSMMLSNCFASRFVCFLSFWISCKDILDGERQTFWERGGEGAKLTPIHFRNSFLPIFLGKKIQSQTLNR